MKQLDPKTLEEEKSLSTPKFRYDINALRAIAVLGVLFFHYKVPFFEGGFSGVDVFFVISGFLMTQIITGSIEKNQFSVATFYGKRLKRIVPALLFLVFVITVITFFLYMPPDYITNQQNAASSVSFLSNIWYWRHSNYFDASSDSNIFLHTWSLSVEWQFYLLYPLLLLLFSKIFKKPKIYFSFFVGLTIIFFFISIAATFIQPTASFYLLPTRAWEMLLGGIALFTESFFKIKKYNKPIAIIGYLLIFGCFFLLNPSTAWPGPSTVVPVFGTFLVLVANVNSFKVIHQQVVQFFGKVSYSLYLWHWPVIVLSQYFAFELGLLSGTCLFVISIILSYLSFRYIESSKIRSKPILLIAAVLLVCNFTLSKYSLNKIFFKSKTLEIAYYSANHKEERNMQMSEGKCFTTAGIKAFKNIPCLDINEHEKNYLLIGDSHGAHISQSLREALAKKGINLLQATASGGLPTYNFNDTLFWVFKSETRQQSRQVMKYIYRDFIPANISKLDGVIISANWAQWPGFSKEQILNYIRETVAYLNKQHVKCIIIGQSEVYSLPYTTILAKDIQYNTTTTSKYLDKSADEMDKFLSSALKPNYIDIYDYGSVPPLLNNETPYMTDGNHFSKYGADLAVSKILANPKAQAFFNDKSQGVEIKK